MEQANGDLTACPICGEGKNDRWDLIIHIGQVHDLVENYLPDEAKIPRECQRRWGRNTSMKTSGVVGGKVTKRNAVFPAIPESFCFGLEPNMKDEEVERVGKEELGPDIVDGFIIEDVVVAEEAEEFGHHPCSDENLKCAICEKMFLRGFLGQAIKHLEELHGVQGLGLQLNLTLSRLISAGYLLRPSHASDY